MKKFNLKNLKIIVIAILIASILALICSFAGVSKKAHAEQLKNKKIINVVSTINAYKTFNQNKRLYELTEKHIEENMEQSLEIETVKNIKDFDGNAYTLFELAPCGYAIYHNDSGKYIEYTSKSISPYINFKGELFYGGAMEYYSSDNGLLLHTLEKDVVIESKDFASYSDNSKQMAAALNEQIIETNLSYINGETKKFELKVDEEQTSTRMLPTGTATPNISMVDFFTNLKTDWQIGYTGGGVCGYVAANMIIGYNYFAYDRGLIYNKDYINETSKTMNGPKLTEKLMTLNGLTLGKDDYPGTTGTTFYKLVGKYLDEVYNTRTWYVQWRVLTTDAVKTLKQGFPVALFGNLPKYDVSHVKHGKGNHAVVAYGYGKYGALKSLTKYRVHYGWDYREDMWLESPVVGTDFFLTLS